MPTAPPASTARAIAARCSGAASGLPGAAWTDTTRPPRIRSSAPVTAMCAGSQARPGDPAPARRAGAHRPADRPPAPPPTPREAAPRPRCLNGAPTSSRRLEHVPRVRDEHLLPGLEQPPGGGARADRELARRVGEDRPGVLVAGLGGACHVGGERRHRARGHRRGVDLLGQPLDVAEARPRRLQQAGGPRPAVVLAERGVEPRPPDREPAAGVAEERSPAVHLREALAAPGQARGSRSRGHHDPVTPADGAEERGEPVGCDGERLDPGASAERVRDPAEVLVAHRLEAREADRRRAAPAPAAGRAPPPPRAAARSPPRAATPVPTRITPGATAERGPRPSSTSAALIVVCPASTASAVFVTRVRPSGSPPCTWPCRCPPSSGSPPSRRCCGCCRAPPRTCPGGSRAPSSGRCPPRPW